MSLGLHRELGLCTSLCPLTHLRIIRDNFLILEGVHNEMIVNSKIQIDCFHCLVRVVINLDKICFHGLIVLGRVLSHFVYRLSYASVAHSSFIKICKGKSINQL